MILNAIILQLQIKLLNSLSLSSTVKLLKSASSVADSGLYSCQTENSEKTKIFNTSIMGMNHDFQQFGTNNY